MRQLFRTVPSHGGIEVECMSPIKMSASSRSARRLSSRSTALPMHVTGLTPRPSQRDCPGTGRSATNGLPAARQALATRARRSNARIIWFTRARIALEQTSFLVDGRPFELSPGMALTAEIKDGPASGCSTSCFLRAKATCTIRSGSAEGAILRAWLNARAFPDFDWVELGQACSALSSPPLPFSQKA
jgi:hypothetical protein